MAIAAVLVPASAAGAAETVLVQFKQRPGVEERQLVRNQGGRVRHEFSSVRAFAVEGSSARLRRLENDPRVQRVEADPPRRALGLFDEELAPALDNGLFGLVTTRSLDAHSRGITGDGVKACVADTGIDADHPDIAPRYQGGIDTVNDDLDPDTGTRGHDHGTHVAGTVLAAVNGLGVRGVAPDADLFHARVLGDSGSGSTADVMAGVQHLVEENGCRIVNLSLGGGSPSDIERELYAAMSPKALIVAAAGNDGSTGLHYPASYPSVVSVAAVDRDNVRAGFSQHNSQVDLSGPGVDVLSAVPRGPSVEATATHAASWLEFSGQTERLTAKMVDAGLGKVASDFPAETTGKIALIARGEVSFASKVQNAMDAGAVAAVIYNNVAGPFDGTLGSATAANGMPWIPAVSVPGEARVALQTDAAQGTDTTIGRLIARWLPFSGTSMASPHVAGVAALVLAANPSLTPEQVRARLQQTAIDLGPAGRDDGTGFGLVNADAALPNRLPLAVNDAYTHYGSDTELSVGASGGVLSNDSDADGSALTARLVDEPTNGTLKLSADGSFTYRPNEDFGGEDRFTYEAFDGANASSAATVKITVGAGCDGRKATISGTGVGDRLSGTSAADVIAGLGGNDTLLSQGGNDIVCGGGGKDAINVNSGDDHADGGSGDDSLRGDVGDDRLLGGLGTDVLGGDSGNDSLSGGEGSPDTCKGDAGTDTADSSCERKSGIP